MYNKYNDNVDVSESLTRIIKYKDVFTSREDKL